MNTPIIDPSALSEEQRELLNKLADEYAESNYFSVGDRFHDATINECVYNAYLAGAIATLSPPPEATLSGWVARDEGGGLYLHFIQPRKGAMEWHGDRQPLTLPLNSFPSLTWQDEPIKVEITIKTNSK